MRTNQNQHGMVYGIIKLIYRGGVRTHRTIPAKVMAGKRVFATNQIHNFPMSR
jgi:hypothetical protein